MSNNKYPSIFSSNPVPLSDLYIVSFSYPVASIVFGDMVIVSLFLLLFFLANPRSCLERYRLAHIFGPAGYCVILIVRKARLMTLMTIGVCGHWNCSATATIFRRNFHLFERHHSKLRLSERMDNFRNDCCRPGAKIFSRTRIEGASLLSFNAADSMTITIDVHVSLLLKLQLHVCMRRNNCVCV